MIKFSIGNIAVYIGKGDKESFFLTARKDFLQVEDDTKILKTNKGAPYFQDGKCFVSYSDKDDYKFLALGFTPVGIDAERLSPRDIKGISLKYFNREFDSLTAFYTAWTEQEAFAKLEGEGIIPFKLRKGNIYRLSCGDYIISIATK